MAPWESDKTLLSGFRQDSIGQAQITADGLPVIQRELRAIPGLSFARRPRLCWIDPDQVNGI